MKILHLPIISHSFFGKEQEAMSTVLTRWFLFYVSLGLLGVLAVLIYYAFIIIPLITSVLILITALILHLHGKSVSAMVLKSYFFALWGVFPYLTRRRLTTSLDNGDIEYGVTKQYRSALNPIQQEKIWIVLEHYVDAKRWDVIYDYGGALIQDVILLHPAHRRLLFEWVGLASMRLEHYREATIVYQKALCEADDGYEKAKVYNSLALAHLQLNSLPEARKFSELAMQIAKLDFIVYNALCIASMQRNITDVVEFARMILRHHPQGINPDSSLGCAILTDPDLAYLRSSQSFSELFPELSGISNDQAFLTRARSIFDKSTSWLLYGGES